MFLHTADVLLLHMFYTWHHKAVVQNAQPVVAIYNVTISKQRNFIKCDGQVTKCKTHNDSIKQEAKQTMSNETINNQGKNAS